MNRRSWTVVRQTTDSPDSVSQTWFVAVELPRAEVLGLLTTFAELNDRGQMAAWQEQPDRSWWPSNPPATFRRAVARLLERGSGLPMDVATSMFITLAKGEWFFVGSVEPSFRQKVKRLATSMDGEPVLEAVVGRPVQRSFPGGEWNRFFLFLQRLGVRVIELPHRDRGGDCPRPSFNSDDCIHMQELMMSEGVEFLDARETPFVF